MSCTHNLSGAHTPAPQVIAATADYRREEDAAARFVAEVLEVGAGATAASDIRDLLEQWCAKATSAACG